MNRKIIWTALIVGSLLWCTPSSPNTKSTSLTETVETTISGDSAKEKKKTTAREITETIDEKVFSYNIKDLIKKNDPLITTSKSYSMIYALGTQDLELILKNYNPHLMKKGKTIEQRKETSYKNIDKLEVPAIFPSVKEFFLPNIDNFLADKPHIQQIMRDFFSKYPEAKKKFDIDKTCVITTKLPNGKMGTAYYENGQLQLAWPTSIGNGKRYRNKYRNGWEDSYFHARSPQGWFFFRTYVPKKRNKDGDAMTNYLELNATNKQGNLRGLWYHGWQRVTGDPASHGCFRFINMLSDQLAKKVKITKWENGEIKTYGTPCFAGWEPYTQELDSVDYYTKWHPNLAKNRLEKQDKIALKDKSKVNPYREKIEKLIKWQTTIQKETTKNVWIESTKTEGEKKDTIKKKEIDSIVTNAFLNDTTQGVSK